MKKEELFDLLEYVDDKYIEEAMLEEFDEARPVEIHAGSSRISPIKIVAPIAACLAVAIGAGFVISNKDKFAITTADSIVAESGSTNNLSELTLTEEEFVEKCKKIVAGESELIAQNETTWQTRKLDVNFDGEDEYLIYPQINKMSVDGVGVRVFKMTEKDFQDLGSFDMDSYNASLDGIYKYPKDGVEAYYFYSDYFDHSTPDGSYVDSIQQLYFYTKENKVETITEMQRITEYGPTDGVVSVKNYLYDNEITETEFYTRWLDYPNIPPIFGEFDCDDVKICKNLLQGKRGGLDIEKCLLKTITIDKTPILLIGSENGELPGIYVFKKTDDEIKMIGMIGGVSSIDSIKYYDELGESYWYYVTYSEALYCGEDSKSTEQAQVVKLKIRDDGWLFEETYLSFYGEYDDYDAKCSYKINGREASKENFTSIWKKHSNYDVDADDLNKAGFNLNNYPQLDLDNIPKLDDYALMEQIEMMEKRIRKAKICSAKYGDYEISLLGQYVFQRTPGDDNIINSHLSLGLSNNGKAMDRTFVSTNEDFGKQGGSDLRKDKLNSMLDVVEVMGDPIVILKFYTDNGIEAELLRIENDTFVSLIEIREENGIPMRNIPFSENYHVENNTLVNDENGQILFTIE